MLSANQITGFLNQPYLKSNWVNQHAVLINCVVIEIQGMLIAIKKIC